MVAAAVLRLESGRVWHSRAAPLLSWGLTAWQLSAGAGMLLAHPRVGEDQPPQPPAKLSPHLPCCVLSAWGWRPGPAPLPGPCLQQPPGHPANCCAGFLPRLCAGRGLCLVSPHPAGLLLPWGWRVAAPPAQPCRGAGQHAKPTPAMGGQRVLMASWPAGSCEAQARLPTKERSATAVLGL